MAQKTQAYEPEPGQVWLTPKEAMGYIRVGKTTFYKLVGEGTIPSYGLTGTNEVRYKREDLERLLSLRSHLRVEEDLTNWERKDAERFAGAIESLRVVGAQIETPPDGKAQITITLESLVRREVWRVSEPRLIGED